MLKRITYFMYGITLCLIFIQNSVAEIVTIQFSGNIESTYGNNDFNIGDQVNGSYTFDTNTQNTSPSPDFGEYRINGPLPPNIGYQNLTIGNNTFTPDPNSMEAIMFIANDHPAWDGLSPTFDHIGIAQCCTSGTLSNGLTVSDIFIDLYDGINNPLSSIDLSSALNNLSSFDKKTMHINGMDNFGGWYNLQVNIASLTLDGGTTNVAPSNLVAFDSLITSIDDPSRQLNTTLRQGETFSGYFTFDAALSNMNPPHMPMAIYNSIGNEKNHMELNLAGMNYKTDHLSDFNILIENREPDQSGPDIYEVDIPTSAIQLENGSKVDQINLKFINLTRQKLTSTELLSSTPTDLTTWYRAYLVLTGHHSDGSQFTIKSSLSSLNPGSKKTTPMATEELFPASGTLRMSSGSEIPNAQILFDASRPPIEYVASMLLNERGEIRSLCHPSGVTWLTNQQYLECPDVKYQLGLGLNIFRVYVRFADGSSKYYMTKWKLVD